MIVNPDVEMWIVGRVVWINTIMSPFRTCVIICHCNNHLFHICWIVTEWMGEELKFKELTAIRCLLRPEGKEVLGEWGCQRCDILIGTNLQICLPTNLFIVLSGNVARLFAESRNLLLWASWILGDKDAAATSDPSSRAIWRQHLLMIIKINFDNET